MRSWLMALCRQGFPRNCLAQQQGLTVGWWWVVVREGRGDSNILLLRNSTEVNWCCPRFKKSELRSRNRDNAIMTLKKYIFIFYFKATIY